MNQLLLLCFSCFLASLVYGQNVPVVLKAINQKGEPVQASTVTFFPITDTTVKQNGITDSTGTVEFQLAENSIYTIRITSVEYTPLEKNINIKQGTISFQFTLQPVSKSLNSVVVVARKPLLRQEDDKTIVDPEPLVNASTNAYEIIEKTPGLFVDQDGNVYLSSTTPARIYINGREQRMSAADIATILKSLPPNAIASIEILRMPSAKYDASGSGGIVNIVLRKGIRIGLTGSLNAGFNQGRYGNQFIGLNLNNSNGKFSSYVNMNVGKRNSFEELTTDRIFATDTLLNQSALTKYPADNFFLGYGINYSFNEKWDLSYDGRVSYNAGRTNSANESIIRKISTGQPLTDNIAYINNRQNNFSLTQGINAKYKIDSAGSEWTTDLSYTYSPNNTDQVFSTDFLQPVVFTTTGDGRIENGLQFFSGGTNYLKKFTGRITFETGVKVTNVRFDNKNNFFNGSNGLRQIDPLRTGSYLYKENINAAYLQLSKSFGTVVLKAGTRMENTNMRGNQLVPKDTAFTINRTDFFPYVYLSRKVMKIAGYDLKAFLVYRRTIQRPVYENLNPSPRYIDPYLFESGNPSLRPQFSQNYEANISVDERPIIAIGINETKDIFNQVVYQADSNRSQAYRTFINLGKNKETYFRALGILPPTPRYFVVFGFQYNHNHYEGFYENKPLGFRRGSWRFFTFHNLKLASNTQVSLNGYLIVKGQLQFYELSNFGQLNVNISQQFLKKKLMISLNLQDIFYTNQNEFLLQQGTINAAGIRRADTKRFGLNLRYNFGFRKRDEPKLPDVEGTTSGGGGGR